MAATGIAGICAAKVELFLHIYFLNNLRFGRILIRKKELDIVT